jgi:hypothetical protein
MTGVSRVRMIPYNFSGPKVLLIDGVNPAAFYDGTTYTQITHASAPTCTFRGRRLPKPHLP